MKRTKIIAEACANHLGEKKLQEEMIYAAREAGADYIKFQSWKAETNTRGQTKDMKKYELSDDDHFRLSDLCKSEGIGFTTTIFDTNRLDFLKSLNLDFIKLASSDCASYNMINEVSKSFPHVMISTGMTYNSEIKKASEIVKDNSDKLTLLHCMYPLADNQYNLNRINWLKKFTNSVGLSDHSAGEDLRASKIAMSMGSDYIERHFTLDRNIQTKDGKVSINPTELKDLVNYSKNPLKIDYWKNNHENLFGYEDRKMSEKELEFRDFYVGRWGNNK